MKDSDIVGHVPRAYSKIGTFLLLSGAMITCGVTGVRQNKRNNGLEVPCKYTAKGISGHILKVESVISDILTRMSQKE